MSRLLRFIRNHFLRFHLIIAAGVLAGIAGGWWGVLCGAGFGAFAEIILARALDEKKIRDTVDAAGAVRRDAELPAEPFAGALEVCALAVYCLQDDTAAAADMNLVFGRKYAADWQTMCRAAHSAESLNGDLLAECIAAKICRSRKDTDVPLADIFRLLQAAEFSWDEKKRGTRPSVYLAQLLDYKYVNNELAAAYAVLGLECGASFAQAKAAHRKLAARYHPDSMHDAAAAAESAVTEQNTAGMDVEERELQKAAGDEKSRGSGDTAAFIRIQNAYELIAAQYR